MTVRVRQQESCGEILLLKNNDVTDHAESPGTGGMFRRLVEEAVWAARFWRVVDAVMGAR